MPRFQDYFSLNLEDRRGEGLTFDRNRVAAFGRLFAPPWARPSGASGLSLEAGIGDVGKAPLLSPAADFLAAVRPKATLDRASAMPLVYLSTPPEDLSAAGQELGGLQTESDEDRRRRLGLAPLSPAGEQLFGY